MNEILQRSFEGPDPLEALLRNSDPHLPDGGFTSRVLLSLPPRSRFDRVRLMVFGLAWLAGVVILVWHSHTIGIAMVSFLHHVRHGEVSALLELAPIMLVLGSLVWALASWAIEEWA